MEFNLENIVRKNVLKLKPYSSARSEFKGKAGIFLDANENAFGSPLDIDYSRYPDPLQLDLKQKLGTIKGLPIQNIFLGNGSDEAIDLLIRVFCNPSIDNVIICPPTYGMYEVSANINDVNIVSAPLTRDTFQLDTSNILNSINVNSKLIFICCPNNPTGNGVKWDDIKTILENFNGVVVIDEAYINFASYRSLIPELLNYPNLVILQTLSKAWGLAGLRIGMAFASESIIDLLNKIKPPYNLNVQSQKSAMAALDNVDKVNDWIKTIVSERNKMSENLKSFSFITKIYPSEANFILFKTKNANDLYGYLTNNNLVLRNRSKIQLCDNCLRITIGTPSENKIFIDLLNNYQIK